MRFAVVRALFNAEITQGLLEGCLRGFADAKIAKRSIDMHEVPGAFELPLAALWLAKTRRYNAIVCLGCVIRGETTHFEYIAGEAARGIAGVSLSTGVPVIFGVLTTESLEQAQARSGIGQGAAEHTRGSALGNKGYEAAQSAIAMVALHRKIDK